MRKVGADNADNADNVVLSQATNLYISLVPSKLKIDANR